MERPPRMKRYRSAIAILIIILFHTVGLVGFYTHSLQPLFLQLVPFHLLLMLLVICFNHQYFDVRFISFITTVFILGYCIEWVGVNKQLVFGSYAYGNTLGVKLANVPLIIGVNWVLLTYATGVLMQRSKISNVLIRVLAGAITLVLLDLVIEGIAVRFDYWHWLVIKGILIAPLKNYIDWFFVSALMLTVFEGFGFKRQSIVGPVLLAAQFLFFLLMHGA